jgi:hypothetical protein
VTQDRKPEQNLPLTDLTDKRLDVLWKPWRHTSSHIPWMLLEIKRSGSIATV